MNDDIRVAYLKRQTFGKGPHMSDDKVSRDAATNAHIPIDGLSRQGGWLQTASEAFAVLSGEAPFCASASTRTRGRLETQ
jgi:hypothetical protein